MENTTQQQVHTRKTQDEYEKELMKRWKVITGYLIFFLLGWTVNAFSPAIWINFLGMGIMFIPTGYLMRQKGLIGAFLDLSDFSGYDFYENGHQLWGSRAASARSDAEAGGLFGQIIIGFFLLVLAAYTTLIIIVVSTVALVVSCLRYQKKHPEQSASRECLKKLGISWGVGMAYFAVGVLLAHII